MPRLGPPRCADGPRERSRQAGFIPNPATWSHVGRDRGHCVAHAAGGGIGINCFPQAALLKRGTSAQGRYGRRWNATPSAIRARALFPRPVYDDVTWAPVTVDFGLLVGGRLWSERL